MLTKPPSKTKLKCYQTHLQNPNPNVQRPTENTNHNVTKATLNIHIKMLPKPPSKSSLKYYQSHIIKKMKM